MRSKLSAACFFVLGLIVVVAGLAAILGCFSLMGYAFQEYPIASRYVLNALVVITFSLVGGMLLYVAWAIGENLRDRFEEDMGWHFGLLGWRFSFKAERVSEEE